MHCGRWEGSSRYPIDPFYPTWGAAPEIFQCHIEGDPEPVLVSRRYTSAVDADNAAEIALDAFAERHGYERDDKGCILEVTLEGLGTGVPCWVERVDRVTK